MAVSLGEGADELNRELDKALRPFLVNSAKLLVKSFLSQGMSQEEAEEEAANLLARAMKTGMISMGTG